MKIATVYDNDGRILAAVMDDGTYDGPRPVADRKSHAGVFDLPATEAKLTLAEICTRYRIDRKTSGLVRE